jgi:hypothetical protein
MKIARFFFVIIAFGGLQACSAGLVSDDEGDLISDQKNSRENIADYLMLHPGNYWVFESYSIDQSTGEALPLNKHDSLFVTKDTLIGQVKYAILQGLRLGEPYRAILRTSGADLTDAGGNLLFSLRNLGDTVRVEEGLLPEGVLSSMVIADFAPAISVPYGTFDALAIKCLLFLASDPMGSIPENSLRQETVYYAKGVGPIQYSSQLDGHPVRIEMRLARCRVQ